MPELDVGASIAGYEIEAVVGRGGMSVVYRARQTALDRVVALKVLSGQLADDPAFRERFLREARTIASTDHPNIRPIYDAGEKEGVLYLAMRYIEGPTLQELVDAEGPLDPVAAVNIVDALAGALDAAHDRSLVHRDVKPSNVMIEERAGRRHVYLTDFGIAKPASARAVTQTGMFVGTLDYIAPEQIEGKALGPTADIYSLGAVLYFALCGRRPYDRESEVAVLYAHLVDPPPRPSEVNPAVPVELDEVVARAMAKSPEHRYANGRELADAARAAVSGPEPAPAVAAVPQAPPVPSATPPPKRRRWTPRFGETITLPAPPPPEPPPAPVPPETPAVVTFRLRDGFRYVHEPLVREGDGMPFIGNRQVVEALKERIAHSSGGSFLVTGFRGVGKTTVIQRALEELAADDGAHVVPISLNVARPMSTDELLFEVVRRLFEALVDGGVFERLSPEIQRALVVSYTRTSLSFKETRSNAVERGRSLDLGLGAITGPVLGRITPKLAFSKKETRSLATEAAFLAYSDADVEHDFLRIVSLVQRAEPLVVAPRRWLGWWRSSPPAQPWLGRLVVVIDELDKLTEREDGLECVEQILTGLKNLLTTRGVHFLFVAGPDLHDRALRESHQGNSVYESVFGWQVYVPCMWDAPGLLLDELVEPDDRDDEWYALLRDYLTFKARGIPRLLLIELNSFAGWRDGRPMLTLDRLGVVRVQFYASLQRILTDFLEESDGGTAPFAIPIDEDRWRLGAYYVTDWILRNKGSEFTVDDIAGSEAVLSVDPTLVISAGKVEQLIEHLVDHGIVEQVRGRADQAYLSDAPAAQKPAYAVVKERYEQLTRFQRGSERERAELAAVGAEKGRADGQPWDESGTFGSIADGRFELLRALDRGGIASVYHARDATGRDVAVKLLEDPDLVGNQAVRARFERQAALATSLGHPNIVPTYEAFALDDGRLGIVMELVDGVSLRSVLDWAPLPGPEAARLAIELLGALEYLSERGIVRLDLKPSNVILDAERKPVIVDLGLAKAVKDEGGREDELRRDVTVQGALVGTPAYLAPEQARGAPVDIRTDIYTVGLLLYEMLTGRPARRGERIGAVIEQARSADVDLSSLQVSTALYEVLARALARDPEGRFATPTEMREALERTPEAATLAAA